VHRNPEEDPTRADIYVRKVRFKSVGRIGGTSLRWDRATGRYSDTEGESGAREVEL
jgi:hypothetical protein